MKNILKSVLAVSAIAFAIPAAAIDIIVVTHGQANDAYWSVVKNGVDEAARDSGVNVDYRSPETFDMVAMSQLIDAATNQEPDGLVVSIPDVDALSPSIRRAVAAGIPVISMNSGSDASKGLGALLHVGQYEYDAGKAAGEKIAGMGGKEAICINHEVGNVALDIRCKGFADGFGSVTVLPTTNDPSEIKSKVAAALAANEKIDTVIALGAATAGEPALAAVKAAGRPVYIASFDLSANFLKSVADGDALFAIDQQPFLQGYLPVSFLALNAKYGLIPSGNVPSGPNFITPDKARKVIELSAKGIR